MIMILSGTTLRDLTADRLKQEIMELGAKPKLVIMQVGDMAESNAYIKQKKLFAEKIGAIVEHKQYPITFTEDVLIADIEKYNHDKNIHGIILQLPISKDLDKDTIIDTIDFKKDTDGLTAINVKRLWNSDIKAVVPATVRGVSALLKHYSIELEGKKVVVVGRSALVGKPLVAALLNEQATVTVCHQATQNLAHETKEADILIVAAGSTKLISKEHVKSGQVVIDVGINLVDGKLVGDVDFEAVKDVVAAISPVPGGVGPMTVASLFENLFDAYKNLNQ